MHNYKSDDVMSLGKVRWRYRTQTSCDDTQWNVRELILVSGDRGSGVRSGMFLKKEEVDFLF